MTRVGKQMARVSRAHRETIAAPAERVFGLMSPLAEYDWIEGWSCEIVYPPSGAMGEGCIFHERMSGPLLLGRRGLTTWVVTDHDALGLKVGFLLFLRQVALAKLEVAGERIDAGSSVYTSTLTVVALRERANRLVGSVTARTADVMLSFLSGALKHYCETGEMLETGGLMRQHGLNHFPHIGRLLGWLRRR